MKKKLKISFFCVRNTEKEMLEISFFHLILYYKEDEKSISYKLDY